MHIESILLFLPVKSKDKKHEIKKTFFNLHFYVQIFFVLYPYGDEFMEKKRSERKRLLKKLEDMAFGRTNDAVRLAFLSEEASGDALERLDLSMLSEIKRGAGGGVEIKLVNRLDIMKLLLSEYQPEPAASGAAAFLAALNGADHG